MGKKYAAIARECIVKRDVIATVIGSPEYILISRTVTQDTCPHDAKVKMAGYDGMYECTRCHKFIHATPPKEKESTDETAPKYMENSWEDDDQN